MHICVGFTNRDYGSYFIGQIRWSSFLVRFTRQVLKSRFQFVIRIVLYKVKFKGLFFASCFLFDFMVELRSRLLALCL